MHAGPWSFLPYLRMVVEFVDLYGFRLSGATHLLPLNFYKVFIIHRIRLDFDVDPGPNGKAPSRQTWGLSIWLYFYYSGLGGEGRHTFMEKYPLFSMVCENRGLDSGSVAGAARGRKYQVAVPWQAWVTATTRAEARMATREAGATATARTTARTTATATATTAAVQRASQIL